jgi:hypothetical protein
MLCLAAGIWLSRLSADWQWFARSGSLLVIIGMVLTSCQSIENNRHLRSRRVHNDDNFHRDFADSVERRRFNQLDAEDIWAHGLRGLYLLVIGTLVWGFGDLLRRVFA